MFKIIKTKSVIRYLSAKLKHIYLYNAISAVVAGILLSKFNFLSLELKANLRHWETITVPGDVRARIFDGILSYFFLLQKVRSMGVSLIWLFVNVKSFREPC